MRGKEKRMRHSVIRFRASDEERNDLLARANARGLSLSELVRRSGLGVRMPTARFDQRQALLLTKLIGQLAHVGSNLNQIARAANARRLTGHSDELSAILAEMDVLRTQVRELIT
jgi:hypothetical protein